MCHVNTAQADLCLSHTSFVDVPIIVFIPHVLYSGQHRGAAVDTVSSQWVGVPAGAVRSPHVWVSNLKGTSSFF